MVGVPFLLQTGFSHVLGQVVLQLMLVRGMTSVSGGGHCSVQERSPVCRHNGSSYEVHSPGLGQGVSATPQMLLKVSSGFLLQ